MNRTPARDTRERIWTGVAAAAGRDAGGSGLPERAQRLGGPRSQRAAGGTGMARSYIAVRTTLHRIDLPDGIWLVGEPLIRYGGHPVTRSGAVEFAPGR